MKRQPRVTKKERKAHNPQPQFHPGSGEHSHDHHQHIHCTACGVHLDLAQFEGDAPTAQWTRCEHNSEFATCTEHLAQTKEMLAEHDRTGQPVQAKAAWH